MTMPIDMVLVRHGESEGNLANRLSRGGDHSGFTEDFLRRHSSTWFLTPKGEEQAVVSGIWIRANIGAVFERYYVSEYVRAQQTAFGLDLPDAIWYSSIYLRERDFGNLDVMSDVDRRRIYADNLARRDASRLLWTPDNGESIASLLLRLERVLDTLHRECFDKRVIIVCHGEVILGFRAILERMTQLDFNALARSRDPLDQIHNGQVVHYTRREPVSGRIVPHIGWMRSVCPNDLSLSRNEWTEVRRPRFTNDELRSQVERVRAMLGLKSLSLRVNDPMG